MSAQQRLDTWLVEHGLVESRDKAQRLILAGEVRVAGQVALKSSQSVGEHAAVELTAKPRFVGRGGEKLEAALDAFGIDARGRICLDVGASTGGFTDCLLQRGAARVYAVDVGRGLVHWTLRQDARVVLMEEVNARYLDRRAFPERPTLGVADVSFISLTKILPAVCGVLAPGSDLVTLIKPQFEAGRQDVGKGGVVRNPAVHQKVVNTVRRFGEDEMKMAWLGVIPSPLKGPAGNVEFLAHWRMP